MAASGTPFLDAYEIDRGTTKKRMVEEIKKKTLEMGVFQ